MGWSIDLYREELDSVFGNMGKKYQIKMVGAEIPWVMIQFEGDMPPTNVMKTIVAPFPESVYVEFVPNSTFPIGSSISKTEIGTGLAETH